MKNGEINVMPSVIVVKSDSCGADIWCEDGSVDDGSHHVLGQSDLDREWERRHNQFHTIGYRDGLLSGKEKSAQEGFNMGFKQSVLAGYNWGLVRGVTSTLFCLPDHLKEQMIGKLEKVQSLYETVQSISSRDATKLFYEDMMQSEEDKSQYHVVGNDDAGNTQGGVNCGQLTEFSRNLELLLLELPNIKVHGAVAGEC
ncbi:uncharacterized protein [Aristolochia californica]|uniref:uncharacterized protein isoform X2 n=1 Tax=Aristolochia californica TaxID=171875 RepID=UPI0035DFAB09